MTPSRCTLCGEPLRAAVWVNRATLDRLCSETCLGLVGPMSPRVLEGRRVRRGEWELVPAPERPAA